MLFILAIAVNGFLILESMEHKPMMSSDEDTPPQPWPILMTAPSPATDATAIGDSESDFCS